MTSCRFIANERAISEFVGISFDTLLIDEARGFPNLVFSGWVAAQHKVVLSIVFRVELSINVSKIEFERPDVVSAFPDYNIPLISGFNGAVSLVGLGTKFRISVGVVTRSVIDEKEDRFNIGYIHGEQDRFFTELKTAPQIRPVLVTANGRSGTTYMMRLISSHPQIAVETSYPMETRLAAHYAKVAKINSEQNLYKASNLNEQFKDIDRGQTALYPNPYFNYEYLQNKKDNLINRNIVSRLADANAFCAVSSIDTIYTEIAAKQFKGGARYFVEKSRPSFIPDLVQEIYGDFCKEIVLVRDPRDAHASALAFNERRKTKDFGANNAKDAHDFIDIRKELFSNVIDGWRRRKETSFFVRYENLIEDTFGTLSGILRYLDVDNSPAVMAMMIETANAETSEIKNHKTSESSKDSIGRWRRDLEPSLARYASELMEADLLEAGYPLD